MKPWLFFGCALVLLARPGATLADSKNDEEQRLIRVLQSNSSPAEKDAACARLKLIGTARCVPALAQLLLEDQLSHSARYALEPLRLAQAETALLNALDKTHGLTRIGIIDSLAIRGEPRAIPRLAVLAKSTDVPLAFAAARALGQIDGPQALKALQNLLPITSGPVRATALDGILACANRWLASGNRARALPVFESVARMNEPDHILVAASRGIILASGDAGLARMLNAIQGQRGPEQEAALQLVREVQASDATHALGKLLPKVGMPAQLALVEGLAQRGDPAAAPELAAFASSAPPEVRPSVLRALGLLGDTTVVPLLAGFAASGNALEQAAARQSLADLHRGKVTEALLAQLPGEGPAAQAELARALGNRGDRAAVPRLLDLSQQDNDSVRVAALKALAELIRPDDIAAVVQIILFTTNSTARTETAEALNTACQRLATNRHPVPLTPLMAGINAGSPEARIALLPLCSGLAVPEVRVALRTALTDPDPQIKTAALRALCDTVDPELLDDLVSLAHATKNDTFRSLAIAGAVRVATQEEGVRISREQQIAVLKSLLETATTPSQKRMVLAGLAETPVLDALQMVEPLVDDGEVHNEAARAAIKIGAALPSMQAQNALVVLNKAMGAANDEPTRQALQAAITKIQASADYITDWQVAGPFRQAGKDYAALFEIVFPAEIGEGAAASWKPLPAATDPARPWVMDLLKTLGGDQCVAYARTWVHSDQDQPARLELGSDDGVKVWLNDKQVYALNTARGLTPGSDKVDVNLHSGWNRLLLKITQNTLGWEFCARFVKPDGSHLDGLQCGATR